MRRNLAWVVLGLFVLAALVGAVLLVLAMPWQLLLMVLGAIGAGLAVGWAIAEVLVGEPR